MNYINKVCPKCKGTGIALLRDSTEITCSKCDGDGSIQIKESDKGEWININNANPPTTQPHEVEIKR
jgi:DnaJ-class molecular chaperone